MFAPFLLLLCSRCSEKWAFAIAEWGLCRPRVGPPEPRGHGPAPGAGAKELGMVLSAFLKSASSLTPWREDEEERVRKLSSDGVDESCFLSTR